MALVPSQVLASASALYGTSCSVAGANNTTGPDGTANNLICDSGTITWKYPVYQFGSTAASCAAGLAGGLQWTGSALQLCNGTTWGTLGFANNGINLGTSVTAANPQIFGDATSGLFTPAGSTVAVTTAGVERLRVTSGGNVGIGTAAPNSNAALDLSANTNSMLLPVGTTGQEPTCNTALQGGTRYNSSTGYPEFCNGSAWIPFKATGAPFGSGYFIATAGGSFNGCLGPTVASITYSGTTATVTVSGAGSQLHDLVTGQNVTVTGATPVAYNVTNAAITVTGKSTFTYTMLSNPGANDSTTSATYICPDSGGLVLANKLCLQDLTSNTGWFGYAQASAAGLLVSSHVKAFLCDATTCQNPTANTQYYFGSAFDINAGGNFFTTDGSGVGPSNTFLWALSNGFGFPPTFNQMSYWGGRNSTSNTQWANTSSTNTCTSWTSPSGTGMAGYPANYHGGITGDSVRWHEGNINCAQSGNAGGLSLVCLVNP
jgi:hypothetical protein